MGRSITIYGIKLTFRYFILAFLLLYVILTQLISSWGECYARHLYPIIAQVFSSISMVIPFAVGDLFIGLSIAWLLIYPFYALYAQKKKFLKLLPTMVEYLLWIYVWFYMAWGLNYSQKNFYQRTEIAQAAYSEENFKQFADQYIDSLNATYIDISHIDKELVCEETVLGYHQISESLGIHRPFHEHPQVKTMLFTPLISMVGVTGSMGPFFCEFTLNGDLLPTQYPATYAHEFAHLLGITSEAEANFYAYQVCTRSQVPEIRFCGYFSVLPHVLANARKLMDEKEYKQLFDRITPTIIELARNNQDYWIEKYNPFIGDIQDWIYDLYLKGNKIDSGRKNYSEVVGLLISYETRDK